jgi:hypothetical protein
MSPFPVPIVVGNSETGTDVSEAFVWDAQHGMRNLKTVLTNDYNLDLAGWTLTDARVSDDGRTFVGAGTDPAGRQQGWIATVPEPGTVSLLVVGSVGLLMRRRRGPIRGQTAI